MSRCPRRHLSSYRLGRSVAAAHWKPVFGVGNDDEDDDDDDVDDGGDGDGGDGDGWLATSWSARWNDELAGQLESRAPIWVWWYSCC